MKLISQTYLLILAALAPVFTNAQELARYTIPLAGNAYITESAENTKDSVRRKGGLKWEDAKTVFSAYFRVEQPGEVELALRGSVPKGGRSTLKVVMEGTNFEVELASPEPTETRLGKVNVKSTGYVKVNFHALAKQGDSYGEITDLIVSAPAGQTKPVFVENNEGNMFYWGRRGPSVHLGYKLPKDKKITYAYSEITVPKGQDPAGSYFMANGFGEGYFGMQVKNETERWVLFSVWSPFSTDDPKSVPAEDRVVMLAKGPGVRDGAFGGEGSGGQSILVYPWKAEVTYAFLNSVEPDGMGNTIYTAWVAEAAKHDWRLIARFKRPKTNTHLTGFHSFLENFYDNAGFRQRRAHHGNQWACDTDGQWHELTSARFTVDATGGGRHRLDFSGGSLGTEFFMQNGGFFSEHVKANQSFQRQSTAAKQPKIDLANLPRSSTQ